MAGKKVLVVLDDFIVQKRLVTNCFNKAISIFDSDESGIVYILPTFFPCKYSVSKFPKTVPPSNDFLI